MRVQPGRRHGKIQLSPAGFRCGTPRSTSIRFVLIPSGISAADSQDQHHGGSARTGFGPPPVTMIPDSRRNRIRRFYFDRFGRKVSSSSCPDLIRHPPKTAKKTPKSRRDHPVRPNDERQTLAWSAKIRTAATEPCRRTRSMPVSLPPEKTNTTRVALSGRGRQGV